MIAINYYIVDPTVCGSSERKKKSSGRSRKELAKCSWNSKHWRERDSSKRNTAARCKKFRGGNSRRS